MPHFSNIRNKLKCHQVTETGQVHQKGCAGDQDTVV